MRASRASAGDRRQKLIYTKLDDAAIVIDKSIENHNFRFVRWHRRPAEERVPVRAVREDKRQLNCLANVGVIFVRVGRACASILK